MMDMMKVQVTLLPTRKETRVLELDELTTVERMIREMDLLPDAWLAVRNNEPLPLDSPLEDDDEIDLISVISGG
jgi:sulfur carrier protein ThiS